MSSKSVKSYLFARWLVLHYTSDYLNKINGNKWKELYNYFYDKVLPNYKKNKSFHDNKVFLEQPDVEIQNIVIQEVIKEVPEKIIYVPYVSNGCDCGQVSCRFCN